MHNLVAFDLAVRVHQHHAVLVRLNLVVFDQKLLFAFHNEDSFAAFRVKDVIVHDPGLAGLFTADCDIGFDVVLDLVRDNDSRATFDY